MRILQINAVNKIGSTGRNCAEIAEYMNAQGDVCRTVFSVGEEDGSSVRISTAAECRIHAVLSRVTGMQGYHSPFATRRLIHYIESFQPDIVHLNNLHANYLSLNMLLPCLARKNIATAVTLHDCWLYTGKCTHYSSLGCSRWLTGCHDCPKLKEDHNSWFFDRTDVMWEDKRNWFREIPALGVIGVSRWITGEAEKSPVFAKAKQIECIYNWIDLDIFRPLNGCEDIREAYGLKKNRIVLGVASRWGEAKGLGQFLSLAEMLPADVRIVLLGDLPRMRLPENVINIPATGSLRKLVEVYNTADVFVQLSREESFGKVVAEALACGVPVVTNSGTANPELVDPTCGVVAGNTTEEIYRAVSTVLDSGKALYSPYCRAFAQEHFSKDTCLKQYRTFYSKLLSGK